MLLKYLTLFLFAIRMSESIDLKSSPDAESKLTWDSVERAYRRIFDKFVNRDLFRLLSATKKLNVSAGCRGSISEGVIAARNFEGWALKMLDASGKIPSGVLSGTVLDFGSFEGCLAIRVNHESGDENFRGKYCMVGYNTYLLQPGASWEKYLAAYGEPPKFIYDLLDKAGAYIKHTAFWMGTCIPSTCSADDVQEFATYIMSPLDMSVTVADCQTDQVKPWPVSATTAVCILCILAGLCTLGIIFDLLQRSSLKGFVLFNSNSAVFRVITSFSLYSNTERLVDSSQEKSLLSCFHGMRFFSALWIILGHTYFFTDTWKYLKYRNMTNISEIFQKYWPTAVLENFTIPVTTFFFMSGFLLMYSTWSKLHKSEGRLNVLKFFLHKFWRMTPAQTLLLVSFLAMPLMGSGPLWNTNLAGPIQSCEKYWWKNILYINNLWNADNYCLIHTWYLGELMQFHLIGIVLLLISFRMPIIGTLLGIALVVASAVITMLIIVWNNFPMPVPMSNKDIDPFLEYTDAIYTKPFCHVASYLIGMVGAHFVLKYKDTKLKLVPLTLGWLLAVTLALFAVYGIYLPSDSLAYRAFYLAFHRIAFSFSLLWMTFCCVNGSGGIVNRILSWNAFIPLGHLSYLVYLFHPLVLLYKTAALHERNYFGHTEFVMEFFSNTVCGFLLAFVGYVAVEIPFARLEKMVFGGESTPKPVAKEANLSEKK